MQQEGRTIRGFSVRFRAGRGFLGAWRSEGDLEGLLDTALGERSSGTSAAWGERLAFVKGGRRKGAGARRHTARRWLLGAPSPCEAEFDHLSWLRARLFRAAEPIAALSAWKRGVLAGEALLTVAAEGARPLDEAWSEEEGSRLELAEELGAELGRMHALRFLHGDVYARNLMVTPHRAPDGPGIGRRIVWLDAWAGGVERVWRGASRAPERDLGCLLLEAAEWMSEEAQTRLLQAYLTSRAANGLGVRDQHRWRRAVERAREREVARLVRRPGRRRGRGMPPTEWRMPGGLG